jgi:addiction module HigA family antidote
MERLPNIHPGEILQLDFLEPMQITRESLAESIDLPMGQVQGIVEGKYAVTADIALRLGRFFSMDPRFWMNLQARYDLEEALLQGSDAYSRISASDQVLAA